MPVPQGALLCDSAQDYGGKVSILGGFVSMIFPPALPVVAPIYFAGRLAFTDAEVTREQIIWVRAIGPDGQQLAEIRGEYNPQPIQNPVPELMIGANVVVPFPFPIQQYGMYRVEMSVNEDPPLVSLPLLVVDRPTGQ